MLGFTAFNPTYSKIIILAQVATIEAATENQTVAGCPKLAGTKNQQVMFIGGNLSYLKSYISAVSNKLSDSQGDALKK